MSFWVTAFTNFLSMLMVNSGATVLVTWLEDCTNLCYTCTHLTEMKQQSLIQHYSVMKINGDKTWRQRGRLLD